MVRDIDPPGFRHLLGHFATGVTIITLARGEGELAGMTASSLASVSLQPPLVSVCIDRTAELHSLMLDAERWTVNILSEHQEALSRRFAEPSDDRFEGVGYTISASGLVLLDGALAHLECVPEAHHPAGDHTLFIGRVVGGAAHSGKPLLYYRGGYGAPV